MGSLSNGLGEEDKVDVLAENFIIARVYNLGL